MKTLAVFEKLVLAEESVLKLGLQNPRIAVLFEGNSELIKDEAVKKEFDRIQRKRRHYNDAYKRLDFKAFGQLAQREQKELLAQHGGDDLYARIKEDSPRFGFFQMDVPYEKVDTSDLKDEVLRDYLARRDEAISFRAFESE